MGARKVVDAAPLKVFLGVLLLALWLAAPGMLAGQESTGESSTSTRLALRTIEADVAPSLDVTLPSGNVSVESLRQLANLGLIIGLDYNFLDNMIGARVGFSYPLGLFVPELIFFDSVDFENTVRPRVSFDEVSLFSGERYITRERGGEARLWVRATEEWIIGPSFVAAEVYKGSLTEGAVIEDAFYYTGRLSTVLDTLGREDLVDDVFFGTKLTSSLDWRFRNSFDKPTELDHITSVDWYTMLRGDLALESRIVAGYPLKVWDLNRTGFYSLGGVESVRGFEPDSIPAYRYLRSSLDIRPVLFPRASLPLRVKKARGTLHRYRLLLLSEVVATQESSDLESKVRWYGSLGAGFSMVLSGNGGNHVRSRFYLSWPVEENPQPILYWQTSFFSLDIRG